MRLRNPFGPDAVPVGRMAGDCDPAELFVPVSPSGASPPSLCGVLSGQHSNASKKCNCCTCCHFFFPLLVYIEASEMTPLATFTITTNVGLTNRFWNVISIQHQFGLCNKYLFFSRFKSPKSHVIAHLKLLLTVLNTSQDEAILSLLSIMMGRQFQLRSSSIQFA